jgi:DNA-binding transcriptional LysR family regulator
VAVSTVDVGVQEIKASRAEPSGLLRIATAPELGRALLIPIVGELLRRYPKVRVELKLGYDLVDLVGESFDLAVRGGPLADSTLFAKKYFDEEIGLWASRSFVARHGAPKSTSDLTRVDFVAFTPMLEALASGRGGRTPIKRAIEPRVILDDLVAIRAFLADGLGVGILPASLARTGPDRDDLVRILPSLTWATLPISFVYPNQPFVPTKTKAFIDLALQHRDRIGGNQMVASGKHLR